MSVWIYMHSIGHWTLDIGVISKLVFVILKHDVKAHVKQVHACVLSTSKWARLTSAAMHPESSTPYLRDDSRLHLSLYHSYIYASTCGIRSILRSYDPACSYLYASTWCQGSRAYIHGPNIIFHLYHIYYFYTITWIVHRKRISKGKWLTFVAASDSDSWFYLYFYG